MDLSQLLSHISSLGPAELVKVRKTVDMLLGGIDDQPNTWDGYVWSEMRKCLTRRGLRLPSLAAVQANPDKKRRLALGADAIRCFLEKATGKSGEGRLRQSLPFVVDTCVKRMERGNAPLSTSVILNRMPDFPALMVNAFPGCNASPAQFSMVRALFGNKPPVT